MVDGHVEESLYLVGMQVHRDDAVHACHAEEVGHELCSDADARLVLAVLSGPSEVGDDGVDGSCRCSLGGINHEEELHQIVRIGECALHEEDVAPANGLFVGDGKFSVGEFRHNHFTKRAPEAGADFLSQVARLRS